MTSDYGADLAYAHDAGFGAFARDAAPALLRLLRGAGVNDGLVVDVGCGSGIWAAALLRAGYDVLGVDPSEAMIEIARGRAPGARLACLPALDAQLPPCAAITALGEVLSYQGDPRAGRASTQCLLARAYSALRPGGVLIFDVVAPGREPALPPRRAWHEGEDWVLCLDARQDPEDGTLERRITVFRRVGEAYRRSDELHRLWAYPRDAALDDLAAAGFEARALTHYGPGVPLAAGHDGYIAVKPVPGGR